MGITGNEVSVANQQRRNEEISGSTVGGALGSAGSIAGAAVTLSASLVSSGPTGLALAGSVVAGMGIVDWFRKLGTTKVSENLEVLGQATEDALRRVENVLREHGTAIDEIKRRFEDLGDAMAGASLHALRTTQQDRLKRLALIIANGVKDGDLAAESMDDMMRAAVELKDADIYLLGLIYDSQANLVKMQRRGGAPFKWHQDLQYVWREFINSGKLNPQEHLRYRSSLSRLESLGLVKWIPAAGDYGVGLEIYALLVEGAKFHERLREIGKDSEQMR